MGRKRYIPESVKTDIFKLGTRDINKETLHRLRFLELLTEHVPSVNKLRFKKSDDIEIVLERLDKHLKKLNPRIRYIYDSVNDTLFKYKSMNEHGKLFYIELNVLIRLKEINFDAYLMFIKEYHNSLFEYSMGFLIDDMDEEEVEHQYGESFKDIYDICQNIKVDIHLHKDIDYDKSKIPSKVHNAIFDTFNFEYFSNVFYPFDEQTEDAHSSLDCIGENSMDIMFAACDTCDGEFGDYHSTMANDNYGNCNSVTTPLLWKAYAPDGTTYDNVKNVKDYRNLYYNFYHWQNIIETYIQNETIQRKRRDEPRSTNKTGRAKKVRT